MKTQEGEVEPFQIDGVVKFLMDLFLSGKEDIMFDYDCSYSSLNAPYKIDIQTLATDGFARSAWLQFKDTIKYLRKDLGGYLWQPDWEDTAIVKGEWSAARAAVDLRISISFKNLWVGKDAHPMWTLDAPDTVVYGNNAYGATNYQTSTVPSINSTLLNTFRVS